MIIQLYVDAQRLVGSEYKIRDSIIGNFQIRATNTGCTDDGSFIILRFGGHEDIHNTVLCRNHRSKNDSILSSSLITQDIANTCCGD